MTAARKRVNELERLIGEICSTIGLPIKHRQICSNLMRQKIMFCHSSTLFKKDLVSRF